MVDANSSVGAPQHITNLYQQVDNYLVSVRKPLFWHETDG